MSEPAAAPGVPASTDGAAGPPSSAGRTTGYLERIAELNPVLGAVITVSPDALDEAAARDQDPAGPRGPLHGVPDPDQGQHRRPGPARHGRVARPPRRGRPRRRVPGRPAARGGRGHPGQGEPVRVGQLPLLPARPAAGARWVARPRTRMPWTATRRGRAPARAWPWRRGWPRWRSAPRPTGRSCARPARAGWWASSPRWAWSAGHGIVPVSSAQDTAGPMTRTVAEAAVLLGVLAGPDPGDPVTAAAEGPAR